MPIKLSFWEEFIISAALSFLTALQSKLTNTVELAAIEASIEFLQDLLSGTVGKPAA